MRDMNTGSHKRVWFNPPKFWLATAKMSEEETKSLMEKVYALAERHEFEQLEKFGFISISDVRDLDA